MDNGCVSPGAGAIDLPRRRVDPELGRRRHRRVTGLSGLLLFVCMFLPAVKGCSAPVYPITMPMLVHPYLFGIVFALGAATFTVRGLRRTIIALRVLAWLTIAGSCVLAIVIPSIAFIEFVLGLALLAAVGRHGYEEKRAALTTILVGAVSFLWFGMWALTPDALVGVYLSTLAAGGLLVGGLVWLAETAYDSGHGWISESSMARARVRGRSRM
jgi:hypothetical protein